MVLTSLAFFFFLVGRREECCSHTFALLYLPFFFSLFFERNQIVGRVLDARQFVGKTLVNVTFGLQKSLGGGRRRGRGKGFDSKGFEGGGDGKAKRKGRS